MNIEAHDADFSILEKLGTELHFLFISSEANIKKGSSLKLILQIPALKNVLDAGIETLQLEKMIFTEKFVKIISLISLQKVSKEVLSKIIAFIIFLIFLDFSSKELAFE